MLRSTVDSRRVLPLFSVPTFKTVDPSIDKVEDLIRVAGMDWNVVKKQAYTADGKALRSYYLQREDTGDILADSVGPDWTPVQNIEKFNWFQPYLDSKLFSVIGAGSLNNGRETSILAKVNLPEVEIVRGDAVGFYVYLSDTFGNRALRGSAMAIRLVCANGAIRQEVAGAFRLRHSEKVKQRLDAVQDTFTALAQQFAHVQEAYAYMASREIKGLEQLKNYFETAFAMKRGEDGELPTRRVNQINELVNHVNDEAAVVNRALAMTDNSFNAPAGRNYWQAYNAVTEYINHEAGHNERTRLDSLLHGQSALIEQRAFELATEK